MIERLLDKYFEGETTAEEERRLRAFFASEEVPEHLAVYKPFFGYFDEEIAKKDTGKEEEATQISLVLPPQKRKLWYWMAGAAACMLILLSLGRIYVFPQTIYCGDNYVVINGRCYTDREKVREHAFNALREVSTTSDEVLIEMGAEELEREIIDNQLRELGNLFLDDDE